MKDYAYNNKKKDQNMGYTLNTLIYDYLIKMKYDKSAKSFSIEAQLEDTKPYEGVPLLSQWYFAFSEISNVRSGLSSNPGDLSRIEGIMLKLENEKKRYQTMGRIDHPNYYGPPREPENMYKGHPMYYPPPYPDQRKMDMYGPIHPPIESPVPFIDPRKPDYGRVQPRPPMRYDEPKNISPQYQEMRYEKPKNISPQYQERPFVLREISSFRITDSTVIFSSISREHSIMFNVVDTRKICAFNCINMKLESEFDTGGKQLVSIRLKDVGDFIYIVGSYGGKELMIMRYILKEGKFDIMGYLRGHSSNIISFDVSDFIYSLDESFILRKWSFKGNCEREEILSGNIKYIFSYTDSTIILSDSNRVYLYDFEMNMEMQELFKGELIETKRIDDNFIFIFREKAAIMDRHLNRVKFLSIPHNNLTTGCYLENDIFLGSQQTLWYECQSRLNKVNIYESGDIISLESISRFKGGHMVSINSIGEFKLMCKSFNE
jgi:hypothetical protein